MRDRVLWFVGGIIFFFLLIWAFGGLYTITSPNGPVDVSYKLNRLTGRVSMIKTYTKQVGPLRVLTAREARVEKTKEITESDMPEVPVEARPGARRY